MQRFQLSLIATLAFVNTADGSSIMEDSRFFLRALQGKNEFHCCSAPTCQSEGIKLQHYNSAQQGDGLKQDICSAPTTGEEAIFTTEYPDNASAIYGTMCRLSSGNHYGKLKDAAEWEYDNFYYLIHESASNNKYKCKGVGKGKSAAAACMVLGFDCLDNNNVSDRYLGVCNNYREDGAPYCCIEDFTDCDALCADDFCNSAHSVCKCNNGNGR